MEGSLQQGHTTALWNGKYEIFFGGGKGWVFFENANFFLECLKIFPGGGGGGAGFVCFFLPVGGVISCPWNRGVLSVDFLNQCVRTVAHLHNFYCRWRIPEMLLQYLCQTDKPVNPPISVQETNTILLKIF